MLRMVGAVECGECALKTGGQAEYIRHFGPPANTDARTSENDLPGVRHESGRRNRSA